MWAIDLLYLLGHGVETEQAFVSVPLPVQSRPLFAGAGSVQVLILALIPDALPQVILQDPHDPQAAQLPSTVKRQ